MSHDLPFDLQSLRAAYAAGLDVFEVVEEVYRRIQNLGDPGIFITVLDRSEVFKDAEALDQTQFDAMPLWGVPFAVKDNIDVAGTSTTAACPEFAYTAEEDAFVIKRLRAAGALLIGKTNLDQFATGLVGMRTPYPAPLNAIDPEVVPGGSSSGSAVAVAQGLVSFSLGTDTAGSGRVPAALNGIVGLKPSRGALSNRGVIPACRTLDCVSIFALTADDAFEIFKSTAVQDSHDAYSRAFPAFRRSGRQSQIRIGVPSAETIRFFGDEHQKQSFDRSIDTLRENGAVVTEINFDPFYAVAEFLYNGPWVAERHTVIEALLADKPDALHPVTRQVTEVALGFSATDTFRAIYRLRELAHEITATMASVDLVCVPSIPKFITRTEVENDPIGPNAQLGTYTNFVNLLDFCALTVPVAQRDDGRPGSVTLIGPSGDDSKIAAQGAFLQGKAQPPLGATSWPFPAPISSDRNPDRDELAVVVVGAHMSGLPLNRELTRLGARFLRETTTVPQYKLFKLEGSSPARPGLVRDAEGSAIAVEVWALPSQSVGKFLQGIPAPLGIGSIFLKDDSTAHGFLCEAVAVKNAKDITHFGGWRAYLVSLSSRLQADKENYDATTQFS